MALPVAITAAGLEAARARLLANLLPALARLEAAAVPVLSMKTELMAGLALNLILPTVQAVVEAGLAWMAIPRRIRQATVVCMAVVEAVSTVFPRITAATVRRE